MKYTIVLLVTVFCASFCEVEARKKTGPPKMTTWPPYGPAICRQPVDEGLCLALIVKYYYNSARSRCEKFEYGGCGGNKNNFRSKHECCETCHPVMEICM